MLLGNGGREHALAWKLAQSSRLAKLWIAPGNAGTATLGENVTGVPIDDPAAVLALAERIVADLVIVGPEAVLAAGVSDALTGAGVPVFGASRAAAELEWSKAFAKEVMARAGVPTATARSFDDPAAAADYVRGVAHRVVVKADGLAAGKGVTVCDTPEEALDAIDRMMVQRVFGEAGDRLLIEERMEGPEASAHAFTDGETVVHMPFSCDHKPVFDLDEGPNTGGMGVYSPPAWLTEKDANTIRRDITEATVHAMAELGRPYRGLLYPGIMLTADGPKVVEYNCRFGDPETEVLVPRLTSDLLELCDAVAHRHLKDVPVEWDTRATVGVILASGGYPGDYRTGLPIHGIEAVDPSVQVFFAGVARDPTGGQLVTSGGRVLCVVAHGDTVAEARAVAYDNVRRIHFEGMHYRTDIAARPIEVNAAAGQARTL